MKRRGSAGWRSQKGPRDKRRKLTTKNTELQRVDAHTTPSLSPTYAPQSRSCTPRRAFPPDSSSSSHPPPRYLPVARTVQPTADSPLPGAARALSVVALGWLEQPRARTRSCATMRVPRRTPTTATTVSVGLFSGSVSPLFCSAIRCLNPLARSRDRHANSFQLCRRTPPLKTS